MSRVSPNASSLGTSDSRTKDSTDQNTSFRVARFYRPKTDARTNVSANFHTACHAPPLTPPTSSGAGREQKNWGFFAGASHPRNAPSSPSLNLPRYSGTFEHADRPNAPGFTFEKLRANRVGGRAVRLLHQRRIPRDIPCQLGKHKALITIGNGD